MTEHERNEIITTLRSMCITPHTDNYEVGDWLGEEGYDDVRVYGGASKICLVFKDKPFVIKWSTGRVGEAMQEVELYKKACAARLEKFFPRTEFFVNIDGVDFVLQERIDKAVAECKGKDLKLYKRISQTAKDRTVMKIQKEFNRVSGGYHRSLSDTWAKMAIVLYGKKAVKALCAFVVENQINDLHTNNLGYKDNRPIILDFSGYHR